MVDDDSLLTSEHKMLFLSPVRIKMPSKGGEFLNNQDISNFELRAKNIVDWSRIDAETKDVLRNLIAEVAALAKKMESK